MGEWLRSLVPWGTEVIVWAQAHSSEPVDTLFKVFTTLGYEESYLVLFPLVYWCIHKPIGVAMAYVSLLSAWANGLVKVLFRIGRPSDPRIVMRAPRPETSPSFPSGHSQNAVANWGYLALRFGRAWLWAAALVLILGIGVSRVVLGVHYPQDVIGGWLIGIVLTAVYALAAPPLGQWLAARRTEVQLIAAVGVPLVLLFAHPATSDGRYPAEGSVTTMAAVIGFGIGLVMERAAVRFRVDGRWTQRAGRFLVGVAVLAVLYVGPKLLIPEGLPYAQECIVRFVRYAVLGWAGAFLCPWLFVRLRLAQGEDQGLP